MERFVRPMALRMKKANVTHRTPLPLTPGGRPCELKLCPWRPLAELQATFQLPIIGVKKNPQSPTYTQLGVLTKGTVVEVNVSELGLVTTGGKVVWAKYARASSARPCHRTALTV